MAVQEVDIRFGDIAPGETPIRLLSREDDGDDGDHDDGDEEEADLEDYNDDPIARRNTEWNSKVQDESIAAWIGEEEYNEKAEKEDEENKEDKVEAAEAADEEAEEAEEEEEEDDEEEEEDDDDDDDDEDVKYFQKFNRDTDQRKKLMKFHENEFHKQPIDEVYVACQVKRVKAEEETGAATTTTAAKARIISHSRSKGGGGVSKKWVVAPTDERHKTCPWVTKFEKTRIIGERVMQLNAGAEALFDCRGELDSYKIAIQEFELRLLPFIIKRPLPNGTCEFWKLSDLEY